MKRLSAIIISIFLCMQVCAQTESCIAVVNVLTQNKDIWDDQTGINYVLANREAFEKENEIDTWLYSIALGARYYSLGKYAEALPYLRNVTTIIDAYGEEIGIAENPQLLETYYWEANCEFQTHASQDTIIVKLQKAKAVFEKYMFTDTEIYINILSDIETLQSLSISQTAMEYVVSNRHREAIPLFEQAINEWPVSIPRKEIFPWFQALGNSYIAIGRLKDAENIYLSALSELDGKQEAEIYRNICDALGVLYCQVHNYQKAKDFSGLSKWLHEKYMDFDESYIRCLSNCAIAEMGLGNVRTAKLFIDVALKYIRNDTGYNASKKYVSNILKIAAITKREINTEIISNQADRMLQLYPYIQVLSNAAMIYQQTGFWEDAVRCIKECIAMSEELGEPYAQAYNNLATLYLCQSKVSESLPYFQKAVTLCQTDYEKSEIWFNYALASWIVKANEYTDVAVHTSEILSQSIASNFSFLSQEERTNYYKHFENYLPFLNLMFYESGKENQFG
ncbi:MAG: tetratricopeptide repeat protein, partial [Prevotella sp.]|nr:tetratricopeptide repeat protein [Prevotella sp.]